LKDECTSLEVEDGNFNVHTGLKALRVLRNAIKCEHIKHEIMLSNSEEPMR
jgi:hypothetical protein